MNSQHRLEKLETKITEAEESHAPTAELDKLRQSINHEKGVLASQTEEFASAEMAMKEESEWYNVARGRL